MERAHLFKNLIISMKCSRVYVAASLIKKFKLIKKEQFQIETKPTKILNVNLKVKCHA